MKQTYQRALITGATSGIGDAFAEILPTNTNLILTGRDADKLAALQKRFTHRERDIDILEADLRLPADRAKLVERSEALGVDLFVNNAGLGYFSHFTETSADDEAAMVDVNVVAVHALTHALLPGMIKRAKITGRRAGLIIVSSVIGHLPMPYFATYAATKAFDLALAEGLAEELSGEPIDILALCPGATATDFQARANAPKDLFDRAESAISVARKGMRALGRRRVLISQLPLRLGLSYNTVIHRIATTGAHAYFKHLMRSSDIA
jgi:short-subunit dehydrogenase